jgi:hypothetical protein
LTPAPSRIEVPVSDRLFDPAISRRSVLRGAGELALAAAFAPKLGLLSTIERAGASSGTTLGTDILGCLALDPARAQAFDSGLPFTINKAMTEVDAWSTPRQDQHLSFWQGSPYTVVWTVSILGNGQTLDMGANHQFDGEYTLLAQKMVDHGRQNDMLRIGHEFNGSWFRWSASGAAQAATFKTYLRNIVTAMRQVDPNFYFIWCPAISRWNQFSNTGDLARYYPGDDFIDGIGLDVYDQDRTYSFDQILTEHSTKYNRDGFGLNWLHQFSTAHHKLMFFPEWGLDPNYHSSKGRPCDNPAFINDMAYWMYSNYTSIGNADYWQHWTSTLSTTSNPNSYAALKSAFSTVE